MQTQQLNVWRARKIKSASARAHSTHSWTKHSVCVGSFQCLDIQKFYKILLKLIQYLEHFVNKSKQTLSWALTNTSEKLKQLSNVNNHYKFIIAFRYFISGQSKEVRRSHLDFNSNLHQDWPKDLEGQHRGSKALKTIIKDQKVRTHFIYLKVLR